MSQGFGGPQNPYGAPQFPTNQPIAKGTVKNYLVESILCLLCCGGVFAIPAIVYAAQVDGKLRNGDYHGAVESSNNAKKWCIIAVCIGVVCNVLVVGLQVMVAMGSKM